LQYNCFVNLVKSKKCYVFSGILVARDARCVPQMCEADEKMVFDSIRRCSGSAGKNGKGMRKKRYRPTKTALGSQPAAGRDVLSTPDYGERAPNGNVGPEPDVANSSFWVCFF
jgi:hypothetical protein